MKVLLTRPEGRNQSMVDALNARGITHYVTPLLGVEPTNDITTDASHPLAGTDIIICISANAVIFANKALNKINAQIATWPKVQYFAVGHATWEALDQLGICAVEAPMIANKRKAYLPLLLYNIFQLKK